MSECAFFLELESLPVIVTGGGEKALKKAGILAEAGAEVSCWSRDFIPEFADLQKLYPDKLGFVRGELTPELLLHLIHGPARPFCLVVASEDPEADLALGQICHKEKMLCICEGRDADSALARRIDRGELSFAVAAKRLPQLEELWHSRLGRELPQDWLNGTSELLAYAESPEVQKLHPDFRERELHDISAAMLDCNGRFEAAKAKHEAQKKRAFF